MTEFEKELADSPKIRELVQNKDFAAKLYCSLENQSWWKDGQEYHCSFRHAGGLVADLRDCGEDYLHWYCSGLVGDYDSVNTYTMATVYPEVEAALAELGWRPDEGHRADNKCRRGNDKALN